MTYTIKTVKNYIRSEPSTHSYVIHYWVLTMNTIHDGKFP